jgi:hypothetical protein
MMSEELFRFTGCPLAELGNRLDQAIAISRFDP